MKFREYDIDEVKILEGHSKASLEEQIKELMKSTILIDLQFSTTNSALEGRCFFALALIKNKLKKEQLVD